MDYEINKHYSRDELEAINTWWQTHREYDINEYEDYVEIVPRDGALVAEEEITELKAKLAATDYQAIKYAEGALTEEEYSEVKAQRAEWRARINELESELNGAS